MKIPKELQDKYDEIAPMIIRFCDEKLNDEYKSLCLRLLEKLCRKRPSPLFGGHSYTWAAGIVYAIGQNNFIFDKTQEPHLTAPELSSFFGISPSTAGNKASELRKMFRMDFFNPEWQLPERIADNPMIWMVMVNDLIVDIRDMPLEFQQKAFEMGLIPYVPGLRANTETAGEKDNEISEKRIIPEPKARKKPKAEENPGQTELW